jgi:hydroxymethylpyrimidine/phosphomethylpyrimidine kinase
MKIALTIAGSDSGGGAGIQADLKTFHQFGVHGTSVIVALTAQNTQGVHSVEAVSSPMVSAQLAALADDLPPDALKTGMLATVELVQQVAAAIRRYQWEQYILDPVMVSTSGHRLLEPEAESLIRTELLPLATVVTPNLPEASLLTGRPVGTEAEMQRAGETLVQAGAGAALIKGGHLAGDELVDLLVTPESTWRFVHPRLATRSTHGTGCTLSAALTALLARGFALDEAVPIALDYLHRAIAEAPGLGQGHGPVHHGVAAITPSIS